MKKRIIPVLIAIVLILVVFVIAFGNKIIDRYSYSKERADLNDVYSIQDETDTAIVLQNELIEQRAKLLDGTYYVALSTVQELLNDRFYEDSGEGLLLYTLPDAIVRTTVGTGEVTVGEETSSFDYTVSQYVGDTLYVALDYVKQYTNFSYEAFTDPNRLQIYTSWDQREIGYIKKDTQVRRLGGVKSEILEDVKSGDKVTILEQMDTWTKVKTADAIIGYVENNKIRDIAPELPIPVTDYQEPEYTSLTRDYKINLGWHVVAGVAGNDTLTDYVSNTKGLNVISPTWFKLNDNEGNFVSLATQQYVDKAHDMGLEVWALVENIEYKGSIDMYSILSSTTNRKNLIDHLVSEALQYGIDGINVDFEQISMDCGEHFIEFIRELSIPCRANGLVLSVDNYVPTGYTDHYDRKEQGVVADYVIIMGYDEHYAGSSEPGSVASIDFVEDGIKQTVEQVPTEKIINAIPFYTRIWSTTGTEVSSQAVGMETAQEYIEAHNIETTWDEETCQNYGEFMDGDTYNQVWLEDAESIRVKLNVMQNYGINGVAFWRLGYETSDVWDVVEEYLNM